jgi:hypothetical protein
MSEELDHRLEHRLRGALHDLDQRVGTHVTAGRPSQARLDAPRRGRRLVPVLAGFAVIVVLAGIGWLARPSERATPPTNPATRSTVTPTPSPSTTTAATNDDQSQSVPEAIRDGVSLYLARMPLSERMQPQDALYPEIASRLTTPEGTWLISRPDLSAVDQSDIGCQARKGKETAEYGGCEDYSEILLLSPDLKHILRAYPIPSLHVQWLVLTPDAIYCGVQGDGAAPDSMVCRIDRSSHRLIGRVFPFAGEVDASPPDTFKGWPGTWSNAKPTNLTGFDQARLRGNKLQILDQAGKPTIELHPYTLKPIT